MAALLQIGCDRQTVAFLAAEHLKLKDGECDLHRFRLGSPVAASSIT